MLTFIIAIYDIEDDKASLTAYNINDNVKME